MTENRTLFGEAPSGVRCVRCHRALTDPISRMRGIGPVCVKKMAVEAADVGASDTFISDTPIREKIVLRRGDNGAVATNVPKAVIHHSPTGYEWGYGGSGPADLALNICEVVVAHLWPDADHNDVNLWGGKCSSEAFRLYQDFKRDFITSVPYEGLEIPWGRVLAWAKAREEDVRPYELEPLPF